MKKSAGQGLHVRRRISWAASEKAQFHCPQALDRNNCLFATAIRPSRADLTIKARTYGLVDVSRLNDL